jgi:hypothetical protein
MDVTENPGNGKSSDKFTTPDVYESSDYEYFTRMLVKKGQIRTYQ